MVKAQNPLFLILHDEKKGIEKALTTVYTKNLAAKSGTARPVKGILVAHKDLSGAIYHPRTVNTDYWDGETLIEGPGRTSVIFHPMFMEEKAILHYLDECDTEGSLPVLLADRSIAEKRHVKSDSSVVARDFYGMRDITRIIADHYDLAFTELSIEEL